VDGEVQGWQVSRSYQRREIKGMSDKKPFKKPAKLQAPPQTAEERAAALVAREKAVAEAKAERERVELYGKALPKMSHRQLRGELRRTIRREHAGKPPQPQAGLTIAWATVLAAVLDNTKTVVDKHTRPDQINPWGKLAAYPR
jgi:hypothetical protein